MIGTQSAYSTTHKTLFKISGVLFDYYSILFYGINLLLNISINKKGIKKVWRKFLGGNRLLNCVSLLNFDTLEFK